MTTDPPDAPSLQPEDDAAAGDDRVVRHRPRDGRRARPRARRLPHERRRFTPARLPRPRPRSPTTRTSSVTRGSTTSPSSTRRSTACSPRTLGCGSRVDAALRGRPRHVDVDVLRRPGREQRRAAGRQLRRLGAAPPNSCARRPSSRRSRSVRRSTPTHILAAHEAGATFEELHRRAYAGEFRPSGPIDLRLPDGRRVSTGRLTSNAPVGGIDAPRFDQ